MNITTGQELRDKIEAKRYDTFTLPTLEVTIKYRKPDILKLSLNHSLPAVLADAVIDAYKNALSGADLAAYQEEVKKKNTSADDNLVQEVSTKGYTLLSDLCVSHKILDVPQSDPENNLISWADIPEEDAIAFLMTLVNRAQEATTVSGGKVTTDEVIMFPDGKSVSKRNSTGKSR